MLELFRRSCYGLLCGITVYSAVALSAVPHTSEHPVAELPVEQLALFAEVLQQIKDNYVEPVDDATLIQHAIEGMLQGLDPHSAFLNKGALQELSEKSAGQYVGLGVEISTRDGYLKIIAPIDGSPAHKAGLQSGDVIVEIDGKPVKGMKLSDAVERLRGEVNSTVQLQIKRKDQDKLIAVSVVRDIIKQQSVRSKILEPGFGYIRVALFQKDTGTEVQQAITTLQQQTPLQGLVLDLRNNPGGILDAAIAVADTFMERGSIVSIRGREGLPEEQHNATPGDRLQQKPLIVLINEGSASASEIVAGAFQDNKRAVILGTTSFGKGSVQRVYSFAPQAGLKLTIARYYTPSGRSIQGTGIVPDIVLSPVKLDVQENPHFLKEKDLQGALSNDAMAQDKSAYVQQMKTLLQDDYQLFEALNLLKTISILGFNQVASDIQ